MEPHKEIFFSGQTFAQLISFFENLGYAVTSSQTRRYLDGRVSIVDISLETAQGKVLFGATSLVEYSEDIEHKMPKRNGCSFLYIRNVDVDAELLEYEKSLLCLLVERADYQGIYGYPERKDWFYILKKQLLPWAGIALVCYFLVQMFR